MAELENLFKTFIQIILNKVFVSINYLNKLLLSRPLGMVIGILTVCRTFIKLRPFKRTLIL